jgi:aminopeptidase-like protein
MCKGVLNYGELILPGETKKEIFLSTYICHPSMANNELSGPVVTTAIAQFLMNLDRRHYTYRIIFIPETIGAIVYLNKNIKCMKKNIVAGFNISCVGDDRAYSYLPSKDGKTLSDRAAIHALKNSIGQFKRYTYLDRGSDERQYCSPGVDLPIASIMRTKYGSYPEYHTSLDDLTVITPNGLLGGFSVILRAIEIIENNMIIKTKVLCEPQFGKRNLRDTIGGARGLPLNSIIMSDLMVYADGKKDLLEVSEIINISFWELMPIIQTLVDHDLIEVNYNVLKNNTQ